MIEFGSGSNTVIKSKLSRRMFILSAAKAIVFFGVFGRLVSLQINESKNTKHYQIKKIDSESGNLHHKED